VARAEVHETEWQDAAQRAQDVADALPSWKTNRIEFFSDLADSIREARHVTPYQLEVIEDAEGEIE
jgi:hypothetical protein